ncbi:hypothetical protein FQZ97_758250 [compost metagenome]
MRLQILTVPSCQCMEPSKCRAGSPDRPRKRSFRRKEKWLVWREWPNSARTSARALLPLPLLPIIATRSELSGSWISSSQRDVRSEPCDFVIRTWSMKYVLLAAISPSLGGSMPMNERFAGSRIACCNPRNVGSALIQVFLSEGKSPYPRRSLLPATPLKQCASLPATTSLETPFKPSLMPA